MEMREKIIGNSIGSRASFVIAWLDGRVMQMREGGLCCFDKS